MNKSVPVSNFHYLLHPYNTLLVTCCDTKGRANIIAIAWSIPVSVQPPLVGMSIRPTRHSYDLIRATGEFVINVAPYEIAPQVLICGRRSGRNVDKFAATGLTAGPARLVQPPVIAECVAHLECRVVQAVETGDHRLVIAEVLAAYARPSVLDSGNLYDLRHVNRCSTWAAIGSPVRAHSLLSQRWSWAGKKQGEGHQSFDTLAGKVYHGIILFGEMTPVRDACP